MDHLYHKYCSTNKKVDMKYSEHDTLKAKICESQII